MSDNFINSLSMLNVGESIDYIALTLASCDKIKNFVEQFSSKKFETSLVSTDKKYRLAITRVL